MSKSWAKGSTTAWRKIRAYVLQRDGYRCQLRLPGCTIRAELSGAHRGHAHHTVGREITGDDPAHIVAACESCNLAVGDPRRFNPRPTPRTRW